jgi:hypothetical protein
MTRIADGVNERLKSGRPREASAASGDVESVAATFTGNGSSRSDSAGIAANF